MRNGLAGNVIKKNANSRTGSVTGRNIGVPTMPALIGMKENFPKGAERRLKPAEIDALIKHLPERYRSEVRQFFVRLPSTQRFDEYYPWYEREVGVSRVAGEVLWEAYQRMLIPANYKPETQYDPQEDLFGLKPGYGKAQAMINFLVTKRRWTVSELAFALRVSIHVIAACRDGAELEFNTHYKLQTLYEGEI